MPNELDNFLGEVNGEDPLTVKKNDNPFEDLGLKGDEPNTEDPKKDEEGGDDSQGKGEDDDDDSSKIPFHKNPRIRRFIEKEVAKATKNLSTKDADALEQKASDSETGEDFVTAFEQVMGNDTPEKVHALKMLRQGLKSLEEKATAGVRQMEADRRAEAEAEKELADGLELIEENFDVDITSNDPKARKLKGEFMEFVERIAPKDKFGNVKDYPDFETSFELFKERIAKPRSNDKAKELAARGLSRQGDASQIPVPRGNSWNDVEKHFSKLNERNN